MPALSIVVPVYNSGQYLRECLNSVAAQSFSDYELILVDDGSADGSGAICDEYARNDPRVRVLHQPNAGQSAARNRGVAAAKTDLICFIDSDDAVHPVFLEALCRALRENSAGAAVAGRVRGKAAPDGFYDPVAVQSEAFAIDEDRLLQLFRRNDTLYWTLFPCLIKKEICERYPLTEGRVMEDNAIACRWLWAAGTVARITTPLYYYRENPTGTMEEAFSEKKLDYLWALQEQLSFCEERGYAELRDAVTRHYAESAVWLAGRVKTELHNKKLASQVLREAVRLCRNNAPAALTAVEKRKLFKAAHPFLHRVRKKLGYLKKK